MKSLSSLSRRIAWVTLASFTTLAIACSTPGADGGAGPGGWTTFSGGKADDGSGGYVVYDDQGVVPAPLVALNPWVGAILVGDEYQTAGLYEGEVLELVPLYPDDPYETGVAGVSSNQFQLAGLVWVVILVIFVGFVGYGAGKESRSGEVRQLEDYIRQMCFGSPAPPPACDQTKVMAVAVPDELRSCSALTNWWNGSFLFCSPGQFACPNGARTLMVGPRRVCMFEPYVAYP